MAAEITAVIGLTALKGNMSLKVGTLSQTYDMAGTRSFGNSQDIGTTYEAIATGADMGTEGWTFFRNQDTTNYVEIGVEVAATFYPVIKLMPGEMALLPVSTTALYARANTSACTLQVQQVER